MANATERTTWDTLPGRPNDLVFSEALQAAIAAELADIDGGAPDTTFEEEIDGGTP
jgi:hypothetical protein